MGVGATRTLWHRMFANLLIERAPSGFEVRAEVQLSPEPQRADLLLVRRPRARGEGAARVLRGLWPRVRRHALLELKTVTRPVRRGDVSRLLGYCAQHFAAQAGRLAGPESLLLVMVVPSITPTLRRELDRMRWSLRDAGGGYAELVGCTFPGLLVVLDDVAAAERDDLLSVFGHRNMLNAESLIWLRQQVTTPAAEEAKMHEMEGYDEVLRKIAQSLPSEHRLAGLGPEERLAGLGPEERLALLPALPAEVLSALSEAFVARLPAEIRAAVRARIAGAGSPTAR